MRVSIVVPALEEARHILAALLPLQALRGEGHEVIVVDGGSRDATVALATPLADRVIVAGRGRALQMNAGAAIAAGDFVIFLHADTQLAASSIAVLEGEIARTRRRWGRFDVAIAGRSRVLPIVAAMMNARSSATGIATGDQAIFVERALFAALGGFADQALMEDIEQRAVGADEDGAGSARKRGIERGAHSRAQVPAILVVERNRTAIAPRGEAGRIGVGAAP